MNSHLVSKLLKGFIETDIFFNGHKYAKDQMDDQRKDRYESVNIEFVMYRRMEKDTLYVNSKYLTSVRAIRPPKKGLSRADVR